MKTTTLTRGSGRLYVARRLDRSPGSSAEITSCRLGTIPSTNLCVDVDDVRGHGWLADGELLRDLAVGVASSEELKDGQFASGESEGCRVEWSPAFVVWAQESIEYLEVANG